MIQIIRISGSKWVIGRVMAEIVSPLKNLISGVDIVVIPGCRQDYEMLSLGGGCASGGGGGNDCRSLKRASEQCSDDFSRAKISFSC
jgi:hypothetical protein